MNHPRKIKSILAIILEIAFLGALAAGVYWYLEQQRPCVNPIKYRIGTFDTRFGVSRASFMDAIKKAAAIWEKPIGRTLFSYDQNGDLQINLAYDERQRETQTRQQVSAVISQDRSLYQTKRVQFDTLKAAYTAASQDYERSLGEFRQLTHDYNSSVQYWNNRGGAPAAEYDRLTQEKNALVSAQQELEQKRLLVNQRADQLQATTNELNTLAQATNNQINTYNSGILVGKEFDAGLYIQDQKGRRITIYQFDNQNKLIRVLAHELGHALGLEHNSNPQSIMYELNQAENEKVSPQDLQELKQLCGVE